MSSRPRGHVRVGHAAPDRGGQMRAHLPAIESGEVERQERAERELRRAGEVSGGEDHGGLRDVVGPVPGPCVRPADHQRAFP